MGGLIMSFKCVNNSFEILSLDFLFFPYDILTPLDLNVFRQLVFLFFCMITEKLDITELLERGSGRERFPGRK